jgi:molecular chaperone Hsp33
MTTSHPEQTLEPIPEATVVANRFIRSRNVLLSEVDAAPLFAAMERHRAEHGIPIPAHLDGLFQDLLAAFTLHCASRPRNELLAWTIRYADPIVSFFFGGDTEIGSVTGRFFEQNIKVESMGEMHQELHRRNKDPHRSMIEFAGSDAASAVNSFYEQSEQRPARFFPLGGTRYALASAHPDYDEGWFTHLAAEHIPNLEKTETLNLLETRAYYWLCGCSQQKIEDILLPIVKKDPSQIFGKSDPSATVLCPRCSATYEVHRETMLQQIAAEEDKP